MHCRSSRPHIQISRAIYDELRKRRRRPLLPNLARVHLASHWSIDLNMVPMFLTDRVTYFGFDGYRRSRHGKDLQVWSAARARAPLIESLALRGRHSCLSRHKPEGTCLGNFISGLRHLKHFESIYFRLPDETIRYLTSLPSLRSLVIPIKDFRDLARICDPNSNPSYTPQLSSLQTLHILCDSLNLGGCSIALRSMNPTSLRELHISSFYGNLSPGELESLFVALRDHCDPLFFEAVYFSDHYLVDAVDIDLNDYYDRDPDLEESINHLPSIIFFRVLKPFLSDYSSLKTIVLPFHLLDADDDEIEEIAACLPMLHRFDLASNPRGQISRSRMTLRSILSFVTHCRHLFDLSLYIDATLPSWPSRETLCHLVHPNLKRLSLGTSTVTREDLDKAGDLFEDLLPNLYEFIWETDEMDSDEDSSPYSDTDEDYSEFSDYEEIGYNHGSGDSGEDDFGEDDDIDDDYSEGSD